MEMSRWINSLSCVWPEGGADNTKATEVHELPVRYILFNGVSYSKIILISYSMKNIEKGYRNSIMIKRNAKTLLWQKIIQIACYVTLILITVHACVCVK